MKIPKLLSKYGVQILFVIAVSAVFITGCAATKNNYSGWLKDYEGLKQDPADKGAMLYSQGDAALKKYTKFIIDPVVVYIPPDIKENTSGIDPELVYIATSYFRRVLGKEIEENFELVNKPGSDVARIRCALTSVELKGKELKAYHYIPVSMLFVAAGELTGVRDKVAVMNMEAELLDSLTGNRMAAVVKQHAHETAVKNPEKLKLENIYPIMNYWARKVKKSLTRIHGL